MRQPSPRLTVLVAGVILLGAGASLALAATRLTTSAPPADAEAPTTVAASVTTAPPLATPGTGAPSTTTEAIDAPPTTSEPAWRAKQREAEQRILKAEGGEQSVGAVAMIYFDPALVTTTTLATAQDPPSPPTRVVLEGGATPLRGYWAGTPTELADYLLAAEPDPRFTVPVLTLATYYVRWAGEVDLRADILWAQMLHETGFGAYGGDVNPRQNNFAGIGATGGGTPGLWFPTAEAGVMAHVAHMVAYVFATDQAPWTNSSVDPRYDNVAPRGVARTLSDLDGRWAVPGDGYGVAIERHVRAINRP